MDTIVVTLDFFVFSKFSHTGDGRFCFFFFARTQLVSTVLPLRFNGIFVYFPSFHLELFLKLYAAHLRFSLFDGI